MSYDEYTLSTIEKYIKLLPITKNRVDNIFYQISLIMVMNGAISLVEIVFTGKTHIAIKPIQYSFHLESKT